MTFPPVNYKVSPMSDYFIANRFYVDIHYSKSLERTANFTITDNYECVPSSQFKPLLITNEFVVSQTNFTIIFISSETLSPCTVLSNFCK